MTERADTWSPRRLLATAGAATAAVGLAIALGAPLGIPSEWMWRPNAVAVRLWPAALVGLGLALVVWLICRPGFWAGASTGTRAGWLALLILTVFALQTSLLNAVGVPLVSPGAIIASPVATTYYAVALDVNELRDWVGSYPEHMSTLPYHARTHPPGFVVLFVLLRRACAAAIPRPGPFLGEVAEVYRAFGIGPSPTDAAAAMGAALIIPLVGALSLWPLYLLGRELLGAEPAVRAAALAASMPALLLFGASPDLVVLTATAAAVWLGYSAWRRGSLVRGFLAGFVLGAGLFLSLGILAAVGWLILWVVFHTIRSADRRAAARRSLLAAGAGLVGLALWHWGLSWLAGYRPLAVMREALFAHHGVTTVEAGRTYWKWVLLNPVEIAVFAGVPVVVAALWRRQPPEPGPNGRQARLFLLGWLIVLGALDLSGTVRGEVGRIWLFLMWPAALAAARALAGVRSRGPAAGALVMLQVWQAIVMRGYLTLYDIF